MFPCACQRDDLIGDLLRRPIRGERNDARHPSQPFPLIASQPARCERDLGDRLLARAALRIAPGRAPCARSPRAGPTTPALASAAAPAAAIACALWLDPLVQHLERHVERDDRVVDGSPPSRGGRARVRARRRSLRARALARHVCGRSRARAPLLADRPRTSCFVCERRCRVGRTQPASAPAGPAPPAAATRAPRPRRGSRAPCRRRRAGRPAPDSSIAACAQPLVLAHRDVVGRAAPCRRATPGSRVQP